MERPFYEEIPLVLFECGRDFFWFIISRNCVFCVVLAGYRFLYAANFDIFSYFWLDINYLS